MKNKKTITWVQICWALAGLGLFAAGIHVVNVPDARLVSVAGHLGLAMLFAGVINLVVYYMKKDDIHGSHWLLADGMSTTFLSIFPLFNTMILPVVIPFFFLNILTASSWILWLYKAVVIVVISAVVTLAVNLIFNKKTTIDAFKNIKHFI